MGMVLPLRSLWSLGLDPRLIGTCCGRCHDLCCAAGFLHPPLVSLSPALRLLGSCVLMLMMLHWKEINSGILSSSQGGNPDETN